VTDTWRVNLGLIIIIIIITRHPVDSSRSRLVTKRRSTRHKQTSKPYCQQCIVPLDFLAVVFKKQKKFTASSHQNAGLYIRVFKNFPRVIPPEARTLTAGGINDPLPHPTHSPNLGPPQLTPVDQLYSNYCNLPIHLLHKQKILQLVHTRGAGAIYPGGTRAPPLLRVVGARGAPWKNV